MMRLASIGQGSTVRGFERFVGCDRDEAERVFEPDRAGVERAADDDAGRRRRLAGQQRSTSASEPTPPEAITGMRDGFGQRARGGDVDALLRAVALDVGVDDAARRRPLPAGAPASTAVVALVSIQPSTATLPSRASMPTATRPGNRRQASATTSGCSQRRGAEDDAIGAHGEDRAGALDACARRRRPRPGSAARRTAPRWRRRSPARRSPRRRGRRRAGSARPPSTQRRPIATGSSP